MDNIAVFLDRDGTLIEEVNYLKNVEDIKLIDGTFEAIKKLNQRNIPAIVVSNQSGVARGYFNEDNVRLINGKLNSMLQEQGAKLDGFYYCPHHLEGTVEDYSTDCDCRKPKPGMIQAAIRDFKGINLEGSFMIGDKVCDVELARNAGCRGILLKTGYGKGILDNADEGFIEPDYVAEDILDAVNWCLSQISS